MPLRSWFEGQGLTGKLRAIQTVSCLLQGPCDAGNRALELSGVMESVIALCASEQEEEQLVAVEALIHAAGKAKRASFITANGVSLLKDLYKGSERDSIRIRALVVRQEAWLGSQTRGLVSCVSWGGLCTVGESIHRTTSLGIQVWAWLLPLRGLRSSGR